MPTSMSRADVRRRNRGAAPFAARRFPCPALAIAALSLLNGCASIGSMMSPYSEKFSCKNRDHGQCIHPDRAYADAVAGIPSHSDPAVTHDKAMLKDRAGTGDATAPAAPQAKTQGKKPAPYLSYRDSLYREMQGLIEAPETPMLRAGRTVRTLIMPYADRERPDRLYMPRYVYSILERPQWVVGDYLVGSAVPAARLPVLGQVKEKPAGDPAAQGDPAPVPAPPEGQDQ
ncbi:TraV family lipoprotein [Novosphingobium sp. SG707]|uniref:TraV family lipoprotein n=1 Tax=Novosphingobium sp. SG707 TaxID=2586996 RepID=UPI0017F67277|nr:TraV family lipoprotein [Novosphingobium sp. SG707]NKJ00361.1 conjugal transfer pilus assembly protein TraV [Novosphingobium sp. SG707]